MLNLVEIESTEVSNISLDKNRKITGHYEKYINRTPNHIMRIKLQPEHQESKSQLIMLQDPQVPQEARDKLSSLLENEFDSTVSKNSTDGGRTNLLKMNIPTTGPPLVHKPYPIPLKYQKFIDEEIQF